MNPEIYREPAIVLAEPAPYLSKFEDCPLCGACPALFYFHDAYCQWWARYLAAGKRMQQPLRGFLVGPENARQRMTNDEVRAILNLVPKSSTKPSLWLRLRKILRFDKEATRVMA